MNEGIVTWTRAASLADLNPDEPMGLMLEGRAVALYLVGDEVVALDDICPHQSDIRLSEGWIEDGMIVCPMHQSQFDLTTGRCQSPPANEDLSRYPTRIEGDQVLVGMPVPAPPS